MNDEIFDAKIKAAFEALPPADMALMNRLRNLPEEKPAPARRRFFAPGRLVPLGAAALALIVVVGVVATQFGFPMFNMSDPMYAMREAPTMPGPPVQYAPTLEDATEPMDSTMDCDMEATTGAEPGAPKDFNTEEYNKIIERGFVSPAAEPLSTFASSVDTASYSLVRGKLSRGESVTPDMVRIEEFVNYFQYDYPAPKGGAPLAVSAELGACPWAPGHLLLQVGVQAEKIDMSKAPPANLVFLIDVSGSMQMPGKLGLVRQSFLLLAENLRPQDRVSVVTYANGQDVLLDGESGANKAKIMSVIESLEAGGYTNGAGGIEAAYKCAERNFIQGGMNRVILATDGDFNVGVTSEGDLSRLIAKKRESGVFLSVLGYGYGNYKDNKMEALAKDGNGNAYYIDSLLEARRVLVEQLGGTLNTVAKDVKLQVEFNPAGVKAYRLLGYESRMLRPEDFANDKIDGGEVGSGHCVTALYEIIPAGSDEAVPGLDLKYQQRVPVPSNELLTVAVRYKLPDGDTSRLIERPVTLEDKKAAPSDNMLWAGAVAEFALVLRQSQYAGRASAAGALAQARRTDYRADPYRAEFVRILEKSAG
ncbi:MAG: von Willebrand factor type A domain-containing protein [Oscillospiraceae bacterium]|nr:von Willebrand factor type A domain-containing protein [Oscillospiraceae bacterium]